MRVRKSTIIRKLMPLAEAKTKIYNKSLKKNLEITAKGVKETANHASKSKPSTLAALDAKSQLRKAVVVKRTATHSNNQNNLKFSEMIVMRGEHEGNPTKVTVGRKRTDRHLLYCITAKKKK